MDQDFASWIIVTSKACVISPEKFNAVPLQKKCDSGMFINTMMRFALRWLADKIMVVWLDLTNSRHCFNCEPQIRSNEVTLLQEQCSSKSIACLRSACGVGDLRLPRLFRHSSNQI